jgi:hypothetical protein
VYCYTAIRKRKHGERAKSCGKKERNKLITLQYNHPSHVQTCFPSLPYFETAALFYAYLPFVERERTFAPLAREKKRFKIKPALNWDEFLKLSSDFFDGGIIILMTTPNRETIKSDVRCSNRKRAKERTNSRGANQG